MINEVFILCPGHNKTDLTAVVATCGTERLLQVFAYLGMG